MSHHERDESTDTERAPGDWPVDEHLLEQRRIARASALVAVAAAAKDLGCDVSDPRAGVLANCRTEHAWLRETAPEMSDARVLAALVKLSFGQWRGTALDFAEVTELDDAGMIRALLTDLGTEAAKKYRKLQRWERDQAKARSAAAVLGREIDRLMRACMNPVLPPDERRAAHRELMRVSAKHAAEIVGPMERELGGIELARRAEEKRAIREQEARWAEVHKEGAEALARERELGAQAAEHDSP